MIKDSLPPDWWTESYNPYAALAMFRAFDDDDLISDSDDSENDKDTDPLAKEEDPRFR